MLPTRVTRPHRPGPATGWARRGLAVAIALALSGTAMGVRAQSLLELYQEAKNYDAAYLAALAQAEAAQHKAAQAYAQRLPQVNLKGTIGRQHFDAGNSEAAAQAAAAAGGSSLNSNVTSKRIELQARQSLYDRALAASLSQADQSLVATETDLKTAEDDLVVRLTQAYFDVLSARDMLSTAQANREALTEQLASAKRNFEVGNATITDTREAQARFDLATAQVLAAENEVLVKGMALDQLVGRQNVTPRPLLTPVALPPLEPATADDWVTLTQASPVIRKAEVGMEVSRLETRKAQAGHYPSVDLVGSISHTEVDGSGSVATLASAGTAASVAVEANVPVFVGFAVQNRVKETLALENKSERDLDNARRSVTLATRQAFFGVQSGMAQVKALEAAELSAKLALEATQLGYRVGVRVNKDVLDAQTALANTQRELYKARYDVLVAGMKLRQVSGSLRPEDLEQLNRLLGAAPEPVVLTPSSSLSKP